MFSRISNSWGLVKASYEVLKADKELVVFPIISSISLIIVTFLFTVPLFLSGLVDATFGGLGVIEYLALFIFYAVQYFVIIFFNTALVSAALIRLNGGDPTVRDGFQGAWSHLGKIVGYALISATVGVILRLIGERGNVIARLVVSLVGVAWNLATFLVIPVLVVEDVGPIDAVKRSAQLLKKSWGEQIVGNISIGLIFWLIALVVILIDIVLGAIVVALGAPILILAIVLLSVPIFIILGLVSSSLSGIFSAAVYQYVTGQNSEAFFPEDMVSGAFKPQ